MTDKLTATIGDGIRTVGEKLNDLGEKSAKKADHLADKTEEVSEHVKRDVKHKSDEALEYIQSNPVKASLIAAISGFAIGVLLSKLGK